jgi:hypothetical protein
MPPTVPQPMDPETSRATSSLQPAGSTAAYAWSKAASSASVDLRHRRPGVRAPHAAPGARVVTILVG